MKKKTLALFVLGLWIIDCAVHATGRVSTYQRVFFQQTPRSTFQRRERSRAEANHEIVIAIQQKGVEDLRRIVYERSAPASNHYQEWLSHEEVGRMVSNPEAHGAVTDWLRQHSKAQIVWSAPNLDYIRVAAPIAVLESMLSAEFYQFEDSSRIDPATGLPRVYHRSCSYAIPEGLEDHISAIFHTVQIPPSGSPDDSLPAQHLRVSQQARAPVTLAWLSSFYQIDSNTADSHVSQSMLAVGESFSPSDLAAFQARNSVPEQPAALLGAKEAPPCSAYSCLRANAALQFQMGLARGVASSFWFSDPADGGDPFVAWILRAAARSRPPSVVVLPSSELESLLDGSVVRHWELEAMKLAGRGVTLVAASGDDGAANRQQDQCLCAAQVEPAEPSSLPSELFAFVRSSPTPRSPPATIRPSRPPVSGSPRWAPRWARRAATRRRPARASWAEGSPLAEAFLAESPCPPTSAMSSRSSWRITRPSAGPAAAIRTSGEATPPPSPLESYRFLVYRSPA